MAAIGEDDYRKGARERLDEAGVLLVSQRWAGSIYLAGRAVEGMLRGLIWKRDPDYARGKKTLDTGHNLRDMLKLVRDLGVLRDEDVRSPLAGDVETVGRLWWNGMRFWPTTKVKREWLELKEIDNRRTIKTAAQDFYNACSAIIKRCEALWQN